MKMIQSNCIRLSVYILYLCSQSCVLNSLLDGIRYFISCSGQNLQFDLHGSGRFEATAAQKNIRTRIGRFWIKVE